MKKCLPICKGQFEEVAAELRKHQGDFDTYEIWLDYLSSLSPESVVSLTDELDDSTELLLLFRRKLLEPSESSWELRKNCINLLQGPPFVWDFDVAVQEQELEYYRSVRREAPLLISYHNYKNTPVVDTLWKLVEKMEAYAPAVLKFACFCETAEDAVTLLRFLIELHAAGKEAVVLGMGEFGLVTRVFGEQFGNQYTFLAADSEELTAAGQMTIGEFKQIDDLILQVKNGRK